MANVYSSGLAGLRQTEGGRTVMRQVLLDTSPLLGSQDATLTSQRLILHLFLPVSLTPCLPSPLSISSLPSAPFFHPHTKSNTQTRSRQQIVAKNPGALPPPHPTSPSSSFRTSTLTLAGVSGYRYQRKVGDKRLHRKKKISICSQYCQVGKNLSFGIRG